MPEHGTLSPELVLHAYAAGVFPMADGRDTDEIHWIDPQRRGIFPLDGFHISRSLRRRIRTAQYSLRFDTAFEQVVDKCAARPETWINAPIRQVYGALFDSGFCHCVEVWEDKTLVGGVYGISIGAAFFGESMFSERTDASKIALAYLIDRLRRAGYTLFDTQFLTPHLASLGAIEIPRSAYHRLLQTALSRDADFHSPGPTPTSDQILQRMTQTS